MYKKNHKTFTLLLFTALMAAGCSQTFTVDNEKKPDQISGQVTPESKQSPDQNTNNQNNTEDAETKDDEIEIEARSTTASKIELNDQTPVKVTSGGTYTVVGSGSTVIVDAKSQDVTLVLDNVTLQSENLPAIYVKKAASVTLELKGKNIMKTGSQAQYEALDAALYCKSDLSTKGTGSLQIDAGYGHGIKAKDTAVFENGTYAIQAEKDGIHVNETAEFQNGTYSIKANAEGIESKDALTIQSGTYNIEAADDGINAANSIVINGGTITSISTGNDGIDSNGDLIINGGEVTAIGARTPETSFDTDNTPLEFNGGKILGIGSMGISVTSAKQPVIQIAASEAVQSVEIKTTDGISLAKWEVPSYGANIRSTALVISDSALKQNETYDLYINNQKTDTLTLTDLITTSGNVQTMQGPNGFKQGNRPGKGQGKNFDQMPPDFNGQEKDGNRPQPPAFDGSSDFDPSQFDPSEFDKSDLKPGDTDFFVRMPNSSDSDSQ